MHICCETFVIYWIGKDSDQRGKEQTAKPQPAAPAQGGKDCGKGDRGRSHGRSQSGKGDKVCYKFKSRSGPPRRLGG
jgi:hypothetical protein